MPFTEDVGHSRYDPEVAERLWRILLVAGMALERFRYGFLGKASPVHFFWGSFDLALTRFSGRTAPQHPGGVPNLADWVTREAYSHEVASCGFWPGTAGGFERPAFYAYAYPEPAGFSAGAVRPHQAYYASTLREVPPAVRRRAAAAGSCNGRAGIPGDDLSGGRRLRRLGPRQPGAPRRPLSGGVPGMVIVLDTPEGAVPTNAPSRARMANVRRLDALVHIEDARVRVQFDIEDARGKLNGDRGL